MDKYQIQQIVTQVIREEPDGNDIQRVQLFGSFLRDEQTPESDVDLLFESENGLSLFQMGGLQHRLQEKIGRSVDFVPKSGLVPQLKNQIAAEAETIYERN